MGGLFSKSATTSTHTNTIGVKSIILDPVARKTYNPASVQAARFIGTLENDHTSSMACLLQDGSILTTLHSIFDLETNRYLNIADTTVTFAYQNKLYTYALGEKVHDGRIAMLSGAYAFDYARFRLIGDPVADLGGGLQLDSAQHFGSAFNCDPPTTQAISGPILSHDENGDLVATQIISKSKNTAASSPWYFFNQEGDHIGEEGMSSQAILYPGTSTLYAIHIGLDCMQQKRFGMKISEYVSAYQRGSTNSNIPRTISARAQTHKTDLILHIQREKLRRQGADRRDIETFLEHLKYASEHQGSWPTPEVYSLALISSLKGNVYLAKPDVIYICAKDSSYIVRSSNNPMILHQGVLHHINLDKLSARLSHPSLKDAVLKFTSQRGHTLHGNIPESLKTQVLDSHQPQHQFISTRKDKGYFYKYFGSEQNPIMHALANCSIKLASEYYQRHLKTHDPVENYNIRHNTRFVIELEIKVGIDLNAVGQETSQVYVHGFDGELCHIYPVVPECLEGVRPICINARAILNEAKERESIAEQTRREALNYRYTRK